MFKNKEYVLTVIKEKGFTKAAERLFVSQPSLSASIKRIEEKIGVPIFDRSSNPISLTEVGQEYLKYALEIEEKERDFSRYVADHTNLLKGTIKLGGSSFFSSFVLPDMISEFNKKHPKINFEIYEDSTKNLMNALTLGNLDLVIDNAVPDDDNIISKVYTSERLLLAVPKRFAVNDKLKKYRMTAEDVKSDLHLQDGLSVGLDKFQEENFVLLHHENDTGKRAEKLFKKYGITPRVIFHLDQQVTAYNVSCTGMGISFVSDTLVKRIGASPDVCYYKLPDKSTVRNIYFYHKKNHYLSLSARNFIDYNTK
ncbi:MAG: LysR family transcriptional regulator [Clostridia bacterium]|nr:LysR family transcriptional regulator [Clostridia bacterium]